MTPTTLIIIGGSSALTLGGAWALHYALRTSVEMPAESDLPQMDNHGRKTCGALRAPTRRRPRSARVGWSWGKLRDEEVKQRPWEGRN
jgi:hypothetical protein